MRSSHALFEQRATKTDQPRPVKKSCEHEKRCFHTLQEYINGIPAVPVSVGAHRNQRDQRLLGTSVQSNK
jgi:hypothetical protein